MKLKGALGPLSDFADPYGRQARLMPALITLSPLALLIATWFPALWTTLGILVSIASSFGLILLLSQLGRDRGKRSEEKLFEMWGGKPSVALLRLRDHHIDDHTKARYRSFIQRKLPDLTLPSTAEESADPESADKAYGSVTAWLLTQTRDTKKFSILFKENVAYGFRRNLWGLKPLGLLISLVGGVISAGALAYRGIELGIQPSPETVIATAVVWLLSIIWLFVVTPSWVRLPADAYGAQLLAACDTLDIAASKPTRSATRART